MAIFLRDNIEKEIERIQARLERDLGMKISRVNTVRRIVTYYKKRNGY